MSDLIYKIKNSTPSLIGETAEKIVVEAFLSDKFTIFHSHIIGMEPTIQVAETFINNLTTIDMQNLGVVNSAQPIHVLNFIPTKDKEKEYWGLLYSNALVLYGFKKNSPNEDYLMILVEKSVAKEQGFISAKIQLTAE